MSDSNREIEELESRLWRYFSNHNYGVGDRTFQRIIELDPERASALASRPWPGGFPPCQGAAVCGRQNALRERGGVIDIG